MGSQGGLVGSQGGLVGSQGGLVGSQGGLVGSQGGLVVIYRASHHCEPGFNSGLGQHVG